VVFVKGFKRLPREGRGRDHAHAKGRHGSPLSGAPESRVRASAWGRLSMVPRMGENGRWRMKISGRNGASQGGPSYPVTPSGRVRVVGGLL